ncbi:hypothetical protein J7E93_27795 [Streptomyces sp. ISL-36]|uniref:helix-turn-helix domain-containing protein n=1 Tax=Streptomyces sp. ISL-36 TaxID=2819182 RepID=UPI001BE676F4|nr:helix-turn-helix transcriptional regulator [Streptomyces sp. ISL-36]MBT2443833.1 hypothetical protein [Streptomyces sp. ISL-36]
MTEVARAQGKSSQIERGEVPEVAALGNVLRSLFNRLGISQNQYAHRVHLDKSAVSRYLGGQRLAPQEFLDRLIAEVEDHLGAPLQLEAKEAIRNQRLEALRVCNPAEFELENLRGELARSRRETDRAHRNIEALHALLEKKESEVRHAADDLTRLRLDWGSSQQGLLREIEQLKKDLQDAERLRADAERHSEDLREHVLRLEEELSRTRPATATGELPLEAFKGQLTRMWEDESFPEAARDLTEAAWSRPLDEVVELLHWLKEHSPGSGTPEALISDVGRLRPVEDLLTFAPEASRFHIAQREGGMARSPFLETWVTVVASRVTERNAAVFYQGMNEPDAPLFDVGDRVLALAVSHAATAAEAARLIGSAVAGARPIAPLSATARAVARRLRTDEPFPFLVVLGLLDAGLAGPARRVLMYLTSAGVLPRPDEEDRQFHAGLAGLDAAALDTLFAFVAASGDARLTGRFADRLHRGGGAESGLLDQLLREVASRSGLEGLHGETVTGRPYISDGLRHHIRRRHGSARQ